MSNISDAYDNLRTRLAAVLPNHKELVDPYNLERNSELFLKQGWGVVVGAGENTSRDIGSRFSVSRRMVVVITRAVAGGDIDVSTRVTAEKTLLEDQKTVINDLQYNGTLNNSAGVFRTDFVSDAGFEPALDDKVGFIALKSEFEIEYVEDVS